MKKNSPVTLSKVLGFLALAWNVHSVASQLIDNTYALRSLIPVVIHAEGEPVYGEYVEKELVRFLENHPRHELSVPGYQLLKKRIKEVKQAAATANSRERMAPLFSILRDWKGKADGLVVCEIIPSPENYKLRLTLALPDGDVLATSESFVEDRHTLNHFSTALTRSLTELQKGIPFDGTILSREGYRVVIDRGFPELRQGMELSAYTMEKRDDAVGLEETGKFVVTTVEEALSFGKVVVERKPLEIAQGNKIKLPITGTERWIASVSEGANAALIPSAPDKPTLGYVNVHLGASMVTLSNTDRGGAGLNSDQLYYPGGSIQGELWLTRRLYFDLGYQFAMTTLNSTSGKQNSNVSQFAAQLGYRLLTSKENAYPTIVVKTGFTRMGFATDPSTDPLSFNTVSYSGLLVGGGIYVPLMDEFNLGFELSKLLTSSVTESPMTSGASVSGSSGWDFILRGQYHLSPVIDIDASLQFKSYQAEFEGAGTRGTPLASSSQSVRALLLGMAYYF